MKFFSNPNDCYAIYELKTRVEMWPEGGGYPGEGRFICTHINYYAARKFAQALADLRGIPFIDKVELAKAF